MQKIGVDEYYKNAIYNMLSNSYKKNNNIELDNIENLYEETSQSRVFIDEALKYSISNNVTIYLAKGELIENKTFNKSEFKIGVIINIDTLSLSILPWEYIEKLGWDEVKKGDTLNINDIEYNIDKTKYNVFEYQDSSNESMAQEYFDIYKFNIIYNKNIAYKNLNSDYSKSKFEDFEDFEKYIKNNIVKISSGKLSKYQVTQNEGYTQYVCIDSNNRYYIFKAKSIMDYEVILDTYTIDIPEFTRKYAESKDQEKVIMNLNKFMLALNDKDYKYAYNLLADSFKNKNFQTLEIFENYVKNKFFEVNKFEYEEFGSEAGTYYTYRIKIIDEAENSNNSITKTFIMILEEETEFKISFNI